MSKLFETLLHQQFERFTQLFWWSDKARFSDLYFQI